VKIGQLDIDNVGLKEELEKIKITFRRR